MMMMMTIDDRWWLVCGQTGVYDRRLGRMWAGEGGGGDEEGEMSRWRYTEEQLYHCCCSSSSSSLSSPSRRPFIWPPSADRKWTLFACLLFLCCHRRCSYHHHSPLPPPLDNYLVLPRALPRPALVPVSSIIAFTGSVFTWASSVLYPVIAALCRVSPVSFCLDSTLNDTDILRWDDEQQKENWEAEAQLRRRDWQKQKKRGQRDKSSSCYVTQLSFPSLWTVARLGQFVPQISDLVVEVSSIDHQSSITISFSHLYDSSIVFSLLVSYSSSNSNI